MNRKGLLLFGFLTIIALLGVSCSGGGVSPTAVSPATANTAPQANTAPPSNTPQAGDSNSSGSESATYKTQTVEGGSVTVAITPVELKSGEPVEFDIAMNTHSVDLNDDMLKIVILRDDSGKEYTPTAWDGPAGGGHHREGKIKFGPLSPGAKSVTLIVKDIAGVPERTYKWDLS